MEQSAPPGGLRISHETYAQVRGVFDVEPQPPLSVKGVDVPLQTYLVVRTRPRAFRVATRGIEGVETRMIGRDAELQALQAAFQRVLVPGAGLQRVLVVADAGVGKSRLLYEFNNWADARPDRFFIFQARATPQSVTEPYSVLRDLFAWRFQILDSDSMIHPKTEGATVDAPPRSYATFGLQIFQIPTVERDRLFVWGCRPRGHAGVRPLPRAPGRACR